VLRNVQVSTDTPVILYVTAGHNNEPANGAQRPPVINGLQIRRQLPSQALDNERNQIREQLKLLNQIADEFARFRKDNPNYKVTNPDKEIQLRMPAFDLIDPSIINHSSSRVKDRDRAVFHHCVWSRDPGQLPERGVCQRNGAQHRPAGIR